MADAEARAVVDQALSLTKSHTGVPALDVLDLAMQGRHGMHPDFDAPGEAFADWTDPSSPFGELLRQAFAADTVRADAAVLWVSEDPDLGEEQDALCCDWQELVIEPFAARYWLWGP